MTKIKTLLILIMCLISFGYLGMTQCWAQQIEQRAVWLQDDSDLDNKLTKLANMNINAVYFGAWGATHMSLQAVIDKVVAQGLDFHLWEANSFICAGQWGSCTNLGNSSWYARLPNGMSLNDLSGISNYVDFGVPAVRQNVVNYMNNYATNYPGLSGVHYDYIRYYSRGSWSFSNDNLTNFEEQYGVAPEIIRGDKFPVFSDKFNANRVNSATTATVLASFSDGVPAILENSRGNGNVLTINFDAYDIQTKVMDSVLKRAIDKYGNSNIYVLAVPGVNDGNEGPLDFTTNWLTYLGYNSQELSISNLATLPAGSLLIAPGVYSFSDPQITTLDGHLTNSGNIIFIDGPVTSVVGSSTFRNIIGANSTSSYLSSKTVINVPLGVEDNTLVSGLIGTTAISFSDASTYIDYWNMFMQNTITSTVKDVSDQIRASNPSIKISGAIFTPESNNGNLRVYQNWPEWLRRGYINYAVPMGYTLNDTTFSNNLDWMVLNNIQDHVVYGLGPYLITQCSQIQTVQNQITELRTKSFPGFSMFQSNYLTENQYTPASCNIGSTLVNTVLSTGATSSYPQPLAYSPDPTQVSKWAFDETSGTTADDSTGTNDGTWSGTGSHWNFGRVGKSALFNGTDDNVFVGNPNNLNSQNEGAVSAWIKINSFTANDAPIIVKASDNDITHRNWSISVGTSTPSIKFLISGGNGYESGTNYAQYFYSPVYYDTWYYVTLAWKKTDRTYMYTYINGHLVNTTSMADDIGTNENISLGKYSTQNVFFSGNVDNLRIFDEYITPIEEMSIFQQELDDMASQGLLTPTPTNTPAPAPTATNTPTPTTAPLPSSNPEINNSSAPAINNNFTPSFVFNDSPPTYAPNLFRVTLVNNKKIQLFYTPVSDATSYLVFYGHKSGDERFNTRVFSINNNQGVQNITIGDLKPRTTYYFKIAGVRGSVIGPWSKWQSGKTGWFPSFSGITAKAATIVKKSKEAISGPTKIINKPTSTVTIKPLSTKPPITPTQDMARSPTPEVKKVPNNQIGLIQKLLNWLFK